MSSNNDLSTPLSPEERELHSYPGYYIDLPVDTKLQKPWLAACAMREVSVWAQTLAEEIYEAIPERVREEDPLYQNAPLSLYAVKVSCCNLYRLIPPKIRENNWQLVDAAMHLCMGSIMRTQWKAEVVEAMPHTMAACLVQFWRHLPPWYCDLRSLNAAAERAQPMPAAYHEELVVEREEAEAWMRSDLIVGYMLLPLATRKSNPDFVEKIMYSCKYPRPEWLCMFPAEILTHAFCLRMVEKKGEYYNCLPPSIREQYEDLAEIVAVRGNVNSLKFIPLPMLQKHPEWLIRNIENKGYNYRLLSREILVAFPWLAPMAMENRNYNGLYAESVPQEVKEANWDLAFMAVMRDAYMYSYVPLSMRDVKSPGATTEDKARMVEMATHVLRYQSHIPQPLDHATFKYHKLFMHSAPDHHRMWQSLERSIPPATMEAVWLKLYDAGDWEHLSYMLTLHEARAAVQRRYEHLAPLVARSSSLLPSDTFTHVLRYLRPREQETEHAEFARLKLRELWSKINKLLYKCRRGEFALFEDYMIPSISQIITFILERFCDPHYAWSMQPADPPLLEPVPPLSLEQQQLARWVADRVSESLQILQVVGARYARVQAPIQRTVLQLNEQMNHWGFDVTPQTEESPLLPLVRAYLDKPQVANEDHETMICEDYRSEYYPI